MKWVSVVVSIWYQRAFIQILFVKKNLIRVWVQVGHGNCFSGCQ